MAAETNVKVALSDQRAAVEFERTLALIKPDAISRASEIEAIIERSGLFVLHKKRVTMTPEQVQKFLQEQDSDDDDIDYDKLYQDLLKSKQKEKRRSKEKPAPTIKISDIEGDSKGEEIEFLTSGSVEILVIAGRGAISKWLLLMGPEDPKVARVVKPVSIRAKFGGNSAIRNAVYGSKTRGQAETDIQLFFPDARYEADFKLGASGEYLSKTVNPILLKGLIQLCRQKPDNPLVWLADWLLANNPNTKP